MATRIRVLRLLLALALFAAGSLLVAASLTGRLDRTLDADRPPLEPDSQAIAGGVNSTAGGVSATTSVTGELPLPGPAFVATATTVITPTPSPTVQPNLVGIIAGHWQYDSGAVCADGRREVDVTTDVALRVQSILELQGFEVDILPEHDPDVPAPPIQGYRAAALVSIHADSCEVSGATGFKVARWLYSLTAEADDRLVDCLYREYAAQTLLPRHDSSITIEMTNYYAFREVAAETPAVIIELGFLGDDRGLLDEHPFEMAKGVANGISCFLGAPPPSAADG